MKMGLYSLTVNNTANKELPFKILPSLSRTSPNAIAVLTYSEGLRVSLGNYVAPRGKGLNRL